MNFIRKNIYLLLILPLLFTSLSNISCDDPYRGIDYTRFQREEAELLAEYYDNDFELDSLMKFVADTIIDKRNESGLYYLELKRGVGEPIGFGRKATFRYDYFELRREVESEDPILVQRYSNYGEGEPDVLFVGGEEWFPGLHEGISFMRIGSKARMVIPSSIGTQNDFITIVLDVEVTAAEF